VYKKLIMGSMGGVRVYLSVCLFYLFPRLLDGFVLVLLGGLSKVVEVVTLLTGIWVVPGSNPGLPTSRHNGYFRVSLYLKVNAGIMEGTAVPLQAWSGTEGSRKLRFSDYMTTAQDGGKVVSLTHRPPLPSGNSPGTHFC
jgi:hypothetical protein